jgi:STIP1 homology and U-box containing protein 1
MRLSGGCPTPPPLGRLSPAVQSRHPLTEACGSIIQDPTNPTLYTNRAFSRLKLQLWDGVAADCAACLELAPDNIKAHYYLSQARLAFADFDDALAHAKRAHELCVMSNDKSLSQVTAQVLRTKQERWEAKEKRRVREGTELEGVVVSLLQRERDAAVLAATGDAERNEILAEWNRKIDEAKTTFEKARSQEDKRRTVPDWVVDDITFAIMVDPVIVSRLRCFQHLTGVANSRTRQKRASRMTVPPSWSISSDHKQTLSPANLSIRPSCDPTLI